MQVSHLDWNKSSDMEMLPKLKLQVTIETTQDIPTNPMGNG
jgi:hypothetical protein